MQCPDCGAKHDGESNCTVRCPECHAKAVAALNARLNAAAAESAPLIAENQAKPLPANRLLDGALVHPDRAGQGGTELARGTGGGQRVIRSTKRFT